MDGFRGSDILNADEQHEVAKGAPDAPAEGCGKIRHETRELFGCEDGGWGYVASEIQLGEKRDGAAGNLVGKLAQSGQLDLAEAFRLRAETQPPGHGAKKISRAHPVGVDHEYALQVTGKADAGYHLIVGSGIVPGADGINGDVHFEKDLSDGLDERFEDLPLHILSIGAGVSAVKSRSSDAGEIDTRPSRAYSHCRYVG